MTDPKEFRYGKFQVGRRKSNSYETPFIEYGKPADQLGKGEKEIVVLPGIGNDPTDGSFHFLNMMSLEHGINRVVYLIPPAHLNHPVHYYDPRIQAEEIEAYAAANPKKLRRFMLALSMSGPALAMASGQIKNYVPAIGFGYTSGNLKLGTLGLFANKVIVGGGKKAFQKLMRTGIDDPVEKSIHFKRDPILEFGYKTFHLEGENLEKTWNCVMSMTNPFKEKSPDLSGYPVLFVLGRHDRIMSYRNGKKLARQFKEFGADVTEISFNGGHKLPNNQHEFASKVVEFARDRY